MTHTKGPWKLEKAHDDYILLHKNIWFMNLVGRWYPSEEQRLEHEANARLIATAPTTYQACVDALFFLTTPEYEQSPESRKVILEILNEAIQKARGEGP